MKRSKRALHESYYERQRYPKWNIEPNVLHEPRLMRRMPAFRTMGKDKHLELAHQYAARAKRVENIHHKLLTRGEKLYGQHGSLIAGGFHEDWPEHYKARIRDVASASSELRDASHAHWKVAGKRQSWPEMYLREPVERLRHTRHSRTR
jgi:hypothetical protein